MLPKLEKSRYERSDRGGRNSLRAVVFDYGNVVSLPQPASDVERMASICGLPLESFCERYWRCRLEYDRAELDGPSYWSSVTDGWGRSLSQEQLGQVLAVDGESWAHPNRKTLAWAAQLKRAGLRVAVLSNMPSPVSEYLAANCEWLELFDHRIFSCSLGSAKPEARIYKRCLETLELGPEQILFLDDRPENVKAACELGIHSLVFDSFEHASASAGKRFGLPVSC